MFIGHSYPGNGYDTYYGGGSGNNQQPFQNRKGLKVGTVPGGNPCGESTDNNTYFHNGRPVFKYPPGSNYERDYPRFTQFLKEKMPLIYQKTRIIEAIKKYTNVSEDIIKNKLKWESGPTIIIESLKGYGEFRPSTPDTIYFNSSMAKKMDTIGGFGADFEDAYSFLVLMKLLHEFVHYADFNYNGNYWAFKPQNGWDEGHKFESYVIGKKTGWIVEWVKGGAALYYQEPHNDYD